MQGCWLLKHEWLRVSVLCEVDTEVEAVQTESVNI